MKIAFAVSCLFLMGLAVSCVKGTTPKPTPPSDSTAVPPDSTVAASDTANLKSGLLLYLPFNGSIADSSGNGNPTVAVNGGGLTYDEHGFAQSAFGANGGGQAILVTNNGSIKIDTAFTVSLDFMLLSNSGPLTTYVSIVNYTNGNGPTFNLGQNLKYGPHTFDFGVNLSDSNTCDASGALNPHLSDTTSLTPVIGSWYNVICVYSKGVAQTYINGTLAATNTNPGNIHAVLCPDAQFVVGGWWSGDPQTIDGTIDNVRLYNRVLNANEIIKLSKRFSH